MSRPKKQKNRNLPPYLYYDASKGYRLTLVNGLRKSVGKDKSQAITLALQYNARMRPELSGNGTIDLLVSQSSKQTSDSFASSINGLHDLIIQEETPSKKVSKALANDIERAKGFFNMHPHNITLETVTDYMKHYHDGCSNEVYNKKIGFLKKLFAWAVDQGIMIGNPAAEKKRRKVGGKKRKRLTLQMYKAVHSKAPLWLQTAMDLSLQTTQARLEVSTIKYRLKKPSNELNGCVMYDYPILVNDEKIYGDLFINRKKTIEKEEAHIRIPIGEELKRIIDRSRSDKIMSPYVVHRLPTKRSNNISQECDHITQLTPKYISDSFTKYRDESGACDHLPFDERPTFHEIRALSARLFKDQGYDPQARMAHSDAKSTEVYTRDHIRWVSVPHAEIRTADMD